MLLPTEMPPPWPLSTTYQPPLPQLLELHLVLLLKLTSTLLDPQLLQPLSQPLPQWLPQFSTPFPSQPQPLLLPVDVTTGKAKAFPADTKEVLQFLRVALTCELSAN